MLTLYYLRFVLTCGLSTNICVLFASRIRSPIGEPYYVFGIGSACYQRSINQSSQFNLKARYHDKAVQYFFHKHDSDHPVLKHWKKYNYQYIDICGSFEKLTSTSVDLLLDPRYTLTDDPSPIARRKITSWKYRSKILVIFLYIEHDLFHLLPEIFSQTDVLLLNVQNEDVLWQNFFMIPGRTQISFQTLDQLVSHVFDVMQWKYVSIILLEETYGLGQIYLQRFQEMFHRFGICFNTDVVPPSLLSTADDPMTNKVINRIRGDRTVNTVFLVGSSTKQVMFLRAFGASNKTWIVVENYKLDLIPSSAGTVIAFHDGVYRDDESTFTMLKNHAKVFYTDMKYSPLKDLVSFDYLFKFYQELLALHSVYSGFLETVNSLFLLKIFLRGQLTNDFLRILVNHEKVFRCYTYFFKLSSLDKAMSPYFEQTSCPAVQCSPGQEYVFKKMDANVSQWNESFQWTCQLCGPGFYKAIHGNTSCQLCPPLYMSNEKRDSCFDPYILKVISIGQPFTLVAIGLTCFGFMSCFGVLLAFIKYRNTPMMKAANVNMTLFHIVLIAANFLLLLLAFYGEPSEMKCYCRLFAMTIFYTIIVGIILLRSQKVLKAFGSRIKMTKSEVRRAFFGEIFFLLILVLVNNLILFIAVNIIPVQMLTILNSITYEKTLHCETWRHSNVLVGFSICSQFVCFIQAFRGRRLPGAFKETMSIVYGNFISILVFITMYPIVVFQKDILMRESVFWIALTLNMNLLVMFCYFRRVYVAIFQPEKNTVEYSRSVIMAKMNKESRQKIKT